MHRCLWEKRAERCHGSGAICFTGRRERPGNSFSRGSYLPLPTRPACWWEEARVGEAQPSCPEQTLASLPTSPRFQTGHSPGDTEVSLCVQKCVRWAGATLYALLPAEVATSVSPTDVRAGQVLACWCAQGHTRAVLFSGLTGQCCREKGDQTWSLFFPQLCGMGLAS